MNKIILTLIFSFFSQSVLSIINGWHKQMDGAWYDPLTSGQGMVIDFDENLNFLFIGWYTFPEENVGNSKTHKWYTLNGNPNGLITDLIIYESTGGIFNIPSEVTHTEVGTATFALTDCNHAKFTYHFPNEEKTGTIQLSKIITVSESTCNELNPLPQQINSSNILVINHVNLVTMIESEVLYNQTIVFNNGLIQEFGPQGTIEIPESSVQINAKGRYLMPGINDMHTHLASSISEFHYTHLRHPFWNDPIRIGETNLSRNSQLMLYLAKGVTTILNTGDFGEPLPLWSQMVKDGELIGPSIYSSHYYRGNRSDCHNGPPHTVVNNDVAARTLLQSAKDKGYNFIKMYSCTPNNSAMIALREGPDQQMPSIGHFPYKSSAKEMVQNGLKAVAHAGDIIGKDIMPTRNPEMIDSLVDLFNVHDFSVISTLLIYEIVAQVWGNNPVGTAEYWDDPENIYMHPTTVRLNQRKLVPNGVGPDGESNAVRLLNNEFSGLLVKELHNAGVNILLGTDSPGLFGVAGFSAHDEMRALQRAGLLPSDILKIATVNGAEFIKNNVPAAELFGQIKAGYRADLILLETNPLESIEIEDQIVAVIARGYWRSTEYFDERLAEIADNYNID